MTLTLTVSGTPSGGIRRLICSKIADLDLRCHSHSINRRTPITNPITVTTTKTMNSLDDSIFVVTIAIRRLNADETRNIAKFRKIDSGGPRSKSWSSDSDIS